jgi:lysyl-tRNA synthetase class 2
LRIAAVVLLLLLQQFWVQQAIDNAMYPQAKKAETAAAQPEKKKAALLDDTEELDPTAYYENRIKFVQSKQAQGGNPYPHKFDVSISLTDYIEKYKDVEAGAQLTDVTVSVAGATL